MDGPHQGHHTKDNKRAVVSLKNRVARLLREFEGFQNVQTERAPRSTIRNPMEESKAESDW